MNAEFDPFFAAFSSAEDFTAFEVLPIGFDVEPLSTVCFDRFIHFKLSAVFFDPFFMILDVADNLAGIELLPAADFGLFFVVLKFLVCFSDCNLLSAKAIDNVVFDSSADFVEVKPRSGVFNLFLAVFSIALISWSIIVHSSVDRLS
jgi:hypothetical protein